MRLETWTHYASTLQLPARLRLLLAKGSIARDCSAQLRDEDQAGDEFLVPLPIAKIA